MKHEIQYQSSRVFLQNMTKIQVHFDIVTLLQNLNVYDEDDLKNAFENCVKQTLSGTENLELRASNFHFAKIN